VHLAGWPTRNDALANAALLDEIAEVRRIVQLGRRARAESGVKLRQPLRRVYVRGAHFAATHGDEIADELRVKEVGFNEGPAVETQILPNLRVLGKRLRGQLNDVRAALAAGDYESLPDGTLRAAGVILGPDDVIRGDRVAVDGWAMAKEDGISIAFDMHIDETLRLEGRAFTLIHEINSMRKNAGLSLDDRIVVTLPSTDADLIAAHGEWIQRDVLAVALAFGQDGPRISKSEVAS
jgi:isoleucyl-tRNA synthetase